MPRVEIGDKLIIPLSYNNKTVREIIDIKNKVGSDCFIATAVYETPFSQEIEILKYWRDYQLRKRYIGRLFIKFYYIFSPYIANFIKNKPLIKKGVRVIIDFLVKYLKNKYKIKNSF